MNSKKTIKKVLSVGLATLMVAAGTTPAFAASDLVASTGSAATDIGGENVVGTSPNQTDSENAAVVSKYKESAYNTDDGTFTNTDDTEVYMTQTGSYTVTVPKVIILDGTAAKTNVGIYQVAVTGDIATSETVNVVPVYDKDNAKATSFAMKQTGKPDVAATITQGTTTFTYATGVTPDNSATTTGTITSASLDAGSWQGTFYFNVSLSK